MKHRMGRVVEALTAKGLEVEMVGFYPVLLDYVTKSRLGEAAITISQLNESLRWTNGPGLTTTIFLAKNLEDVVVCHDCYAGNFDGVLRSVAWMTKNGPRLMKKIHMKLYDPADEDEIRQELAQMAQAQQRTRELRRAVNDIPVEDRN